MAIYTIADGVGSAPIYEESPDFLKQAVIKGILTNDDIAASIVRIMLFGFQRNIYKWQKHALKNTPELVPFGSHGRTSFTNPAIRNSIYPYVQQQLSKEASDLYKVADQLKSMYSASHPEYLAMQAKADIFLAASANPTINIINYQTSYTPDYANLAEHYWTSDHGWGLYNSDDNDNAFTNTSSIFPQKQLTNYHGYKFKVDTSRKNPRYETRIELQIRTKNTYEDGHTESDGDTESDRFREPTFGKIPGDILDAAGGELSVFISYQVEEIGPAIFRTFKRESQLEDSDAPPVQEITKDTDNFPILIIRKNNINTVDLKDSDEALERKLYKNISKQAKLINLNLNTLTDQIIDNTDIESVNDAFVMMLANMKAEHQTTIKYNVHFYGALREGVPWAEYDPSKVYDQDKRLNYFDERLGHRRPLREFYAGGPISDFPTFTYSTATPNRLFRSFFYCKYIYSRLYEGTIGKIGFGTVFTQGTDKVEGHFTLPYTEYKYQVSKTHYRLVEIFVPVISYTNYYFGKNSLGNEGNHEIYEDVDLDSPNTSMLAVPMNYILAESFGPIEESTIYTENLSLYFYSVEIEKVPGWQRFLSVLSIILIVVAPLLGGIINIALVVIGAVISMVIQAIIAIITSALGAEAGLIAGIVLTVLSIGLTYGSSIANVALRIPNLTIELISNVTGIILDVVSLSFSIQNLLTTGDMKDLLELQAETQKEFEDTAEELGLNQPRIHYSLLGVGTDLAETPARFFNRTLNVNPGKDFVDISVNKFVELTKQTPEYIFLPQYEYPFDKVSDI